MNVKIRNARHQDLDAMVALLQELFSIEADFEFDRNRQQRGLVLMLDGCGKHRCVKVGEVDGGVVAMCTAQILVSTAEGAFSVMVEDMVVAEDMRGQGIGAALLATVEAWARQRGATRLQLLADRENLPALTFYRKHGWHPTQLICLRKT